MATHAIGYEAVWRSSSSKLHLTRAETQFLHDGNSLSHLFFLLWQREHEARALAGAGDGTAETTRAVLLLGVIGEEKSREMRRVHWRKGCRSRSAERAWLAFTSSKFVSRPRSWV